MTTDSTTALQNRYADALMDTYGQPPVALASGNGRHVTDVDGRTYLDMIGGIAVSTVGHRHPDYVEAVVRQTATIAHTSNLFFHPTEVELAETLVKLTGADGRVFFSNSGTEANEAALKLALKAGKPHGKTRIVAAENSFHGRTLGTLAVTGKASIREPFAPFGIEATFVPYGDTAALTAAVDDTVAAVILEPTQGEAGVVPASTDFLHTARALTHEHGSALILDEIQAGFGRTGRWFAHHAADITPDIITLAKGLAGGIPMGATIGVGDWGNVFQAGDHGSTFGGNPIAGAAALAVIDIIEREDLFDNVNTLGRKLENRLHNHPAVIAVRGEALWRGIVLDTDIAADVCGQLRNAGILANPVRPNVIRIAPPLSITAAELEQFTSALTDVLDQYPAQGKTP
ncbi:acetylornithine transaminase [Haloglycomyces albus]|uniref:acetylornithine transaminase n=1 Tax=Haloglycomyces albus TaxID=526067 RepID=UPI00046D0AA7|nr:acetylornithine transaminase [Haloglycomyces albus]